MNLQRRPLLLHESDEAHRELGRAYDESPTRDRREPYRKSAERKGDDHTMAHLAGDDLHDAQDELEDHFNSPRRNMSDDEHKAHHERYRELRSNIHYHTKELQIRAKRAKQPPGHFVRQKPTRAISQHIDRVADASGSSAGGAFHRTNKGDGHSYFPSERHAKNFANSMRHHYQAGSKIEAPSQGQSSWVVKYRLPGHPRTKTAGAR